MKRSKIISNNKRGAVLILVLWVVMILTAIGIFFHGNSYLELRVVENSLNLFAAQGLAEAGLESAKAALSMDDTPYDSYKDLWRTESEIFLNEDLVEDARYLVIYDDLESDREPSLGITDEESKLNLNTADREMLMALPGMTGELADALLDWRDSDEETRESGAENDYYQSLSEPYNSKNGPLDTFEELLLVKGYSFDLLYGEDTNWNGVLDTSENDGEKNFPSDNSNGKLDRGLKSYVTIYSFEPNVDPQGVARININTAEKEALKERLGDELEEKEIDAILEYRKDKGDQVFKSIGDLLVPREGDNQNALIDKDKFKKISERISVDDEKKHDGRINVNTASREVLSCIFREKEEVVKKIIEYRDSQDGPFKTIGELLDVDGMTDTLFRDQVNHLTVRSTTFEILSTGYLEKSKAICHLKAVIDRSSSPIRNLYWKIY